MFNLIYHKDFVYRRLISIWESVRLEAANDKCLQIKVNFNFDAKNEKINYSFKL